MDVSAPKHLVLIGGGHSHVVVLKSLGLDPLPGVRVTMVSRGDHTPYSGMIPGYIAGHYKFADAHINVQRLCDFAGARFVPGTVTGIDLAHKRMICAGSPVVDFDFTSLDIGSTPQMNDIPGARQHALPVKPVDRFLEGWDETVRWLKASRDASFRIVVVGGGAGGVELALAIQYRLLNSSDLKCLPDLRLDFHLVTATSSILPDHNRGVQARFERILRKRGVRVHLNHRVTRVEQNQIRCEPGNPLDFHCLIWATNASAPAWLGESGLQTDENGFVFVNDCLQSTSHPFVFASGDIAAVSNHPRPKSGVFAVRQGAPLARNLRLALKHEPPVPFVPQKKFLSLISTGDKYAVASRGNWSMAGAWVWRWKDWIDRRWMRQYQELPDAAMPGTM